MYTEVVNMIYLVSSHPRACSIVCALCVVIYMYMYMYMYIVTLMCASLVPYLYHDFLFHALPSLHSSTIVLLSFRVLL